MMEPSGACKGTTAAPRPYSSKTDFAMKRKHIFQVSYYCGAFHCVVEIAAHDAARARRIARGMGITPAAIN